MNSSPRPAKLLAAGLLLLGVFFLICPDQAQGKVRQKTDRVAKQYRLAMAYYENQLGFSGRRDNRLNWFKARQGFEKIYQQNAGHDLAPNSLFMAGRVALDAYRRFKNPLDQGAAIISFKDLVTLFGKHRLADDALFTLATIYHKDKKKPDLAARTYARIAAVYPKGDMAGSARDRLLLLKGRGGDHHQREQKLLVAQPPTIKLKNLAMVKPLRSWSTADYTRVVIEVSRPVVFRETLLPNGGNGSRRLAVVLYGSRFPAAQQCLLPVGDGLLKQVGCEQYSGSSVRLVLETESVADYKIFSLEDPFRVVVDLTGREEIEVKPVPVFAGGPPSLAQQLGLGIRRIVLDAGHGGKDPGAMGLRGIKEKDVTLRVARRTAERLKATGLFDVELTRDRDIFIPLEERTAIANSRNGDLFVSIHVNANPERTVKGVETYFLDLARNKNAMRIAALENASSTRQLSDLQDILLDIMSNAKMDESAKLAEAIQTSMVHGLASGYGRVENLGVKRAPFIVLIGAQMPAVLTEIAFLTNPQEARRLQDSNYIDQVAKAIVEGLKGYARELSVAQADF